MIARLVPLLGAALVTMVPSSLAAADKMPANWDGLVRVEAKKLAAVYLLPGADFTGYSKVIIDRPQVAFHKDWKRNYNQTQRGLSGRVDDADMRAAIDDGTALFVEALGKAYAQAGYQIVDQPGEDVLRVSTAAVNIAVTSPDQLTASRTTTYAHEAGEATLVVEVKDSLSGALMGRAVDRQIAGDRFGRGYMRNRSTNRGDFEELFMRWAKISAEGLVRLKADSSMTGQAPQ